MKTKSLFGRKVQLAFGSAILVPELQPWARSPIAPRSSLAKATNGCATPSFEVLEDLQNLPHRDAKRRIELPRICPNGAKDSSSSSLTASASMRSRQEEAAIRNLTADNPRTAASPSGSLKRFAIKRFNTARTVIALRQTKGLESAADAIQSGPDQQLMDEFQAAMRAMQDEELRLLALRVKRMPRGGV